MPATSSDWTNSRWDKDVVGSRMRLAPQRQQYAIFGLERSRVDKRSVIATARYAAVDEFGCGKLRRQLCHDRGQIERETARRSCADQLGPMPPAKSADGRHRGAAGRCMRQTSRRGVHFSGFLAAISLLDKLATTASSHAAMWSS